jgi:hypothetical protein
LVVAVAVAELLAELVAMEVQVVEALGRALEELA